MTAIAEAWGMVSLHPRWGRDEEMSDRELAELYARILRWLRRRIRRRELDHLEDDLVGAAGVSFARALKVWRPTLGPLPPLAWRYVKQGTLGLLAREARHGSYTVSSETVSIEEPTMEPRIPSLALLDPTDPDHRIAWSHLVEGESLRRIAKTRSISIRCARQGLSRALARLEDEVGVGRPLPPDTVEGRASI